MKAERKFFLRHCGTSSTTISGAIELPMNLQRYGNIYDLLKYNTSNVHKIKRFHMNQSNRSQPKCVTSSINV